MSESPLIYDSTDRPGNRPRKAVAGACLVVSLTIHILAIIAVLLASRQSSYRTPVTYIDMESVADSAPPATTPVIHSPAPLPEKIETEQPLPLPENPSDESKTEAAETPVLSSAAEVMATSLGRGMTSGYFSSFAEGKNLREDIREYYFTLLEKINTRWWLKAETLKESALQDGVALFVIGRDGMIIDLKLTQSTGSREVDLAIIEVLKATAPFPALPASYTSDRFLAPLRIAAPLRLFSARGSR